MGSPHANRSQEKLHKAFVGFANLVSGAIRTVATEICPRDKPIRILDIGCGTVPYSAGLNAFQGHSHETILLDRDDTIVCDLPAANFVTTDFFELYDVKAGKARDGVSDVLGVQKFDLVLLCASLHELYFDAVHVYRSPDDFHRRLLDFIASELMSEDSFLILADYAWPPASNPTHVWQIKAIQEQEHVAGHADPPWAFAQMDRLQSLAAECGLKSIRTTARGLYDSLSDDDLAAAFNQELLPAELATARLRLGFVLTFTLLGEATATKPRGWARPQAAAIHVSREAEKAIRGVSSKDRVKLEGELQRILTERVKSLNDHSPLRHLAEGIGEQARATLKRYHISEIGVFEAWVSVAVGEIPRFNPRLPCPWIPKELFPAGVLISDGLAENDEVDLLAGWVAAPYDAYLAEPGAPSIHKWAKGVNEALRQQRWGARNVDSRRVRSVTLIAPGADDTARALVRVWGSAEDQLRTGHYVHVMQAEPPNPEELAYELDHYLNEQIAKQVLGEEGVPRLLASGGVNQRAGEDLYGYFLAEVLAPPAEWSNREFPPGQLAERVMRLHGQRTQYEHHIAKYVRSTHPSRYSAYSTVFVGCDGVTPSDPDTIMLFGKTPFPPPVLDVVHDQARQMITRLVEIEYAERKSGAAREEEAEKRLSIVAGTSHAFKNLLTPMKGGLAAIARDKESSLHGVLEAYRSVRECGNENFPSKLTCAGGVLDVPTQHALFSLAMSMTDYQNIVDRLWGKVHALHISSLAPDKFDITRWYGTISLPYSMAGSAFCAWYAFTFGSPYADLRQRKHEDQGSSCVIRMSVRASGKTYSDTFRIGGPASRGSMPSLRTFSDVESLNGKSPTLPNLPEVILQAFAEELLFNAIKYGRQACGVDISLRVEAGAPDTCSLMVENEVAREAVEEGSSGHGLSSLALLATVCGGELTRPNEEEVRSGRWRVTVDKLRLPAKR